MNSEKKVASLWWIAFYHTIVSVVFSSLIGGALGIGLAMFLPESAYEQTEFMWYTMTVVGLVILGLVTWNQAKFIRNRYAITDAKKATLYSTIIYILLGAVFLGIDWWTGYQGTPEEYVLEFLSLVLFFLVTKRYLR